MTCAVMERFYHIEGGHYGRHPAVQHAYPIDNSLLISRLLHANGA